jgi:hypothetical protein
MARKILFFIAGMVPTASEAAKMAQIVGDVQERSAFKDTTFGGRLEDADGLAGTIPAAYKTASGGTAVDTTVFPLGDVTPNAGGITLFIAPGTAAIAGTGTLQLRVIAATLNEATGAITMTDVTSGCTFVSGTPAAATVNANTGLATGVAAGTTTITATYDFDGGGTETPITATRAITVS